MGMTDTATRLIKRFGQTAILRQPGAPQGDPWNPTPGVPIDHDVIVAVTEYTLEQRTNSGISDSDLRVFMTAGVEPSTSYKLVIGGKEFHVHGVGTLGPDGVVICYELQVRR